jgi:hypothetical protein
MTIRKPVCIDIVTRTDCGERQVVSQHLRFALREISLYPQFWMVPEAEESEVGPDPPKRFRND